MQSLKIEQERPSMPALQMVAIQTDQPPGSARLVDWEAAGAPRGHASTTNQGGAMGAPMQTTTTTKLPCGMGPPATHGAARARQATARQGRTKAERKTQNHARNGGGVKNKKLIMCNELKSRIKSCDRVEHALAAPPLQPM